MGRQATRARYLLFRLQNMDEIKIHDESGDKRYFTIIPNYILNHSSANDQALYLQMKRYAGEDGECFATQKTLMEKMGIGERTLRKSLNYLLEHGWITFVGLTNGKTRPVKTYKINDIWKINTEFYKKKIVVKRALSPKKQKDSGQMTTKIPVRIGYRRRTYNKKNILPAQARVIPPSKKEVPSPSESAPPSPFWGILTTAEKQRGARFANRGKQLRNLKLMVESGIKPSEIGRRFLEMTRSPFWKEHGFDFKNVYDSFDRKPPQ